MRLYPLFIVVTLAMVGCCKCPNTAPPSSTSSLSTDSDPVVDGPTPLPPPKDTAIHVPPGTIALTLTADTAAANNEIVSVGVPFAPGVLKNTSAFLVRDGSAKPVSIFTKVLATWPHDQSIRSVLVAFRASLTKGSKAVYSIAYDANTPSPLLSELKPNPDGPIGAILSAEWYASSWVSGPHVTAQANTRFRAYDQNIEAGLFKFKWDDFSISCDSTSKHRTYYDSPHALYQRFLRYGEVAKFRRARAEAKWFRENELRFHNDRALAVQKCQAEDWTPERPLNWGVLRNMISQGMLDDYLMTGDPQAREAIVAMGKAIVQNLPALTSGREVILEITERNMAWPMMTLAAYYAVEPNDEVLKSLRAVVDRTIAWQKRGASGAFEHDIVRPDPDECARGPKGASPFMTALMVDGLMDYYQLTRDTRVVDVVVKVAKWLETKAITSDKKAFRYLWNCEDDPKDDSETADLNMLIVPVFGAAYALTFDKHWIEFGDRMADIGIEAMYVGKPKQWSQATRAFGKYMGYRELKPVK